MLNFEHYLPTHFVFGRDAEQKCGEMTRTLGGTRALLVYGGGSAVRSGLLARLEDSLAQSGVFSMTLGGALPNPRASLVYEGIRLVRENHLDFVIGVGGGSALDTAKAISIGATYDGDFWDFYCGKATPVTHIPVGAVLTIAATGSESSNSSVIMKDDTRMKRGLRSEFNRPVFALLNPALTCTVSAYQTASGSTDIMAHVLERYFTNEPHVDLTDRMCEAVLSSVMPATRRALRNPDDYDARAELLWANCVAHNDTVGVGRLGDWASHQLEHELSGLYDCAHGAGLAVVLPAWMKYVYRHDVNRFAQLAVRVFGCDMNLNDPEETALAGIARFEDFLREIGMPLTLEALGGKADDIPELSAKVKRGPGGTTGQFVKLNTEDIAAIYRLTCEKAEG